MVKQWDELTDEQKEWAKHQYIAIRAIEDEITEEAAAKLYDTSDEFMKCLTGFEIENDSVMVII